MSSTARTTPFAVFAAGLGDLGNAVEHQHRRQRQLRPLAEQLAAAAGQEILVVEACTPVVHSRSCLPAKYPGPEPGLELLT